MYAYFIYTVSLIDSSTLSTVWRWGYGGIETLKNLPTITQPLSGRAAIWPPRFSSAYALILHTLVSFSYFSPLLLGFNGQESCDAWNWPSKAARVEKKSWARAPFLAPSFTGMTIHKEKGQGRCSELNPRGLMGSRGIRHSVGSAWRGLVPVSRVSGKSTPVTQGLWCK
jgi:hypothetical protein